MSLDLHVACGRLSAIPITASRAADLLRECRSPSKTPTRRALAWPFIVPAGDEEHRRRLKLITDLRDAIDQDGLTLVYQPKVTMATRSVKSLEALVRWTHPQLGPGRPAEFVPLAERTGGARRLTSWVLAAAIGQMGEWRRRRARCGAGGQSVGAGYPRPGSGR